MSTYLPITLTNCTQQKSYVLPEECRELRPKHVGAIINKNTVQRIGIKYYIYNYIYIIHIIYITKFFFSELFSYKISIRVGEVLLQLLMMY